MYIKLNLILIILVKVNANWKLKWSEDFNETTLDTNEWFIFNEDKDCEGNWIKQLNCNKNDKMNLWLTNGSLAIASVWNPQYVSKKSQFNLTSAQIQTKVAFPPSIRIEIRAALPVGKMLIPAIFLVPDNETGEWPSHGEINIMRFTQNKTLYHGIHFLGKNGKKVSIENVNHTDATLEDIHTYVVEWNTSKIVWKLDQDTLRTIDLEDALGGLYNPFEKKFKLRIRLGVGGQEFNNNNYIDEEDVRQWNCSLFILDYIRVYNWVEDGDELMPPIEKRFSSSDICENIMEKIRPSTSSSRDSTSTSSINRPGKLNLIMIFTSLVIIFLFI